MHSFCAARAGRTLRHRSLGVERKRAKHAIAAQYSARAGVRRRHVWHRHSGWRFTRKVAQIITENIQGDSRHASHRLAECCKLDSTSTTTRRSLAGARWSALEIAGSRRAVAGTRTRRGASTRPSTDIQRQRQRQRRRRRRQLEHRPNRSSSAWRLLSSMLTAADEKKTICVCRPTTRI